jgi:hypothetical protein
MPPLQIMVIRHGEKPTTDPPTSGVDLNGKTDPHSLIVVGWQRAGALVRFFSSPQAGIEQPTYLISPPPESSDSNSKVATATTATRVADRSRLSTHCARSLD